MKLDLAVWWLLPVGIVVTACDDLQPSAPPGVVQEQAATATQNNPTTNTPSANDSTTPANQGYSPAGKRDPFRSFLADGTSEQVVSGEGRRLEDTEKFELDAYHLTGLITGTSQPKALVEDPAKKGHVVRIGSRLGKRNGRVTRILNNMIVVTEEIITPTGERVRVPITVKLRTDESENMISQDQAAAAQSQERSAP